MLVRLELFTKRKLREAFPSYYQQKDRVRLKNRDFVLISRNGWGGQAYQWLGLPYNSPFVGLFLYGPCYMKLLNDFDTYMQKELDFIEVSQYPHAYNDHPLALLGDVEIHFQHYKSNEEAQEKWNSRKRRMVEVPKENCFFTIFDRRQVTPFDMKRFHQLEFKNKLSFSFDKIEGLTNRQYLRFIKDYSKKKIIPPNGKKRFKLSFLYFDLVHWLNRETIIRTRFKD